MSFLTKLHPNVYQIFTSEWLKFLMEVLWLEKKIRLKINQILLKNTKQMTNDYMNKLYCFS